jgi:YegS/Rv2252/BmrU family lipid kinase
MIILASMLRVAVIVNGSKPKALSKAEAYCAFAAHIASFSNFQTIGPGHAIKLAEECCHRFEIIAVFGGDGTLSECVNGVMNATTHGDVHLPEICLIPCGTGNDFSRNFSRITSPEDFALALKSGVRRTLDVLQATAQNGQKKYIINAGDAGFGAAVVNHLEANRNRPSLLKGFGWSILHTFSFYRKKEMSIQTENAKWSGKALMIAFNNGKYFGNGIGISPEASPSNGQLQITIIGAVSVWEYVTNLPKLRKCKRIKHPEVHYLSCRKALLTGNSQTEFDGEFGLQLPIEIRVIPQTLRWIEKP